MRVAPWLLAVVVPVGLPLVVARVASSQGNPAGSEFRINTNSYLGQDKVAAGSALGGDFVVVWRSSTSQGDNIQAQRFAASGSPLGPEFRVNTYLLTSQSGIDRPAIAWDGVGNFIAVWPQIDVFDEGIRARIYSPAGVPVGNEFRVNSFTNSTQGAPAAAGALSGGFVVVWHSQGQDGSGLGVFGQRYTSFGTLLGPEFRVNSFTNGTQGVPAVAADGSGNFVVVWIDNGHDGSGFGVFGQRFAASGTPLGSEFRVNTYTTGAQSLPSVAADTAGNFVVVWQSYYQDGSNYGVFGQRYASSGAPLGPEFLVNTYTEIRQYTPSVAADMSGNFVVVWTSVFQDGPDWGVFGQRFAAAGTALGPEFRSNTITTNFQRYPAVASDAAGNFVVVWEAWQPGSDYWDIFGQRYSPITPVELMRLHVE